MPALSRTAGSPQKPRSYTDMLRDGRAQKDTDWRKTRSALHWEGDDIKEYEEQKENKENEEPSELVLGTLPAPPAVKKESSPEAKEFLMGVLRSANGMAKPAHPGRSDPVEIQDARPLTTKMFDRDFVLQERYSLEVAPAKRQGVQKLREKIKDSQFVLAGRKVEACKLLLNQEMPLAEERPVGQTKKAVDTENPRFADMVNKLLGQGRSSSPPKAKERLVRGTNKYKEVFDEAVELATIQERDGGQLPSSPRARKKLLDELRADVEQGMKNPALHKAALVWSGPRLRAVTGMPPATVKSLNPRAAVFKPSVESGYGDLMQFSPKKMSRTALTNIFPDAANEMKKHKQGAGIPHVTTEESVAKASRWAAAPGLQAQAGACELGAPDYATLAGYGGYMVSNPAMMLHPTQQASVPFDWHSQQPVPYNQMAVPPVPGPFHTFPSPQAPMYNSGPTLLAPFTSGRGPKQSSGVPIVPVVPGAPRVSGASGSVNFNYAPWFPVTEKPRGNDPWAQQEYERWLEWRKAMEPDYKQECKWRQAARVVRQ